MSSLHIERAGIEQAHLVHRIMLEAFAEYIGVLQPPSGSTSESLEDVERVIRQGGAVLAWLDSLPVGAGRFLPYPEHLYVGRVATLPAYRGRGIASAMMAYIEGIARELGVPAVHVGVRKSLPRNLSLYLRLGYEIVSIEPHPRGPDEVVSLIKRL